MNLERLTVKSQEALQAAQATAVDHGHPEITPEDLLHALLNQEGGLVPILLNRIGVDVERLRRRMREALGASPRVQGGAPPGIGDRLRRVLESAERRADGFHDDFVSVEHCLLSLVETPGGAADALREAGVTAPQILEALKSVRGSQRVTSQNPEDSFQTLEKYARNLTEMARRGKLDPVIGRDEEIRRVVQVLSRRTKNNPVLIGEPGVGKTAIVERHTLVGAGAAEGAVDASNMLKPALARGELRCVGATTLKEYRQYIEKDAALERRFQPIMVQEPSVEDTIAILRGLKDKYEVHHKVKIKDAALVVAAVLSHRYIADRFLPDKAIDLIDEAASRLRIQIDSMPQEIDEITRRIMQLEIERVSVARDSDDPGARERLGKLDAELATLKEQADVLKAQWQAEKQGITGMSGVKEQIEAARQAMADAERRGDLNKAAELRFGTLPTLEKKLVEMEKGLAEQQKRGR